jgi:hypothetical protein
MDNLTVFIVIIIILVLFFIFLSNNSKCNSKKRIEKLSSKFSKIERQATMGNDTSYLDKLLEYTKNFNNSTNYSVLPYFVEMQFHNDYKDVITAFDIICESGRPIFNRSSEPVKFTPLENKQGDQMVELFINQLNTVMKDKIKDIFSMENGWQNIQENPSVESGWEKQMKKLGVPSNIYDKGTKKAVIRLIKIDKVDMFETDSQIKYDIYCIIQKDGSYDQMIIKIGFVMDRNDMNEDRNFFNDDKTVDLNVHVESIFVVGYMTNHSYGSQNKNVRQDFYTFENIEKNGIMDDAEVIKQLKKKYLDYQIESNGLTVQMSPVSGNNLAIERLTGKTPIGPVNM